MVPTARERAIQRAIATARDLIAKGDSSSLLAAAQTLVDTEAITIAEGAALASSALSGFRASAPDRLQELLPVLERAHTLLPGTADTFSALAAAYYEQGDMAKAETAVASGLVLSPFRADLLTLRVRILLATDRWFQAQTPLDALLKTDPTNADGLLLRATMLWQFERDGRTAIQVVQEAFSLHPEDLRFPELQGYILHDQGQRAESLIVLSAVLERDPTRTEVIRFLLVDAVSEADWAEARRLLERLPEPATEAELTTAQRIYQGLGHTTRAAELAGRLDAMHPDRRYAPLAARGLLDAGDRERALQLIAEALGTAEEGAVRSELYYLRAVAAGGPYTDEAVRDLQRALSENPANAEAMSAMARHFEAIGEPRKALQYARSALRYRQTDQTLRDLIQRLENALDGGGSP